MRYFYEYKEKNGSIVGGHNLENIIIDNNIIFLKGVDIIKSYDDYDYNYFHFILNMDQIEYLKITPMFEEEE